MNNQPIPFSLALRLCSAGLPQPLGWAYTDGGLLVDITEPLQYIGNVCCAAPSYGDILSLLKEASDTVRRDCLKIMEGAA